jgi:hypothetical protein
MCAQTKLPDIYAEPLRTTITRFCVVVVFSIAFANIEASVVVYLKHIFHPDGFKFPMTVFGEGPHFRRFLFTEIGREAATMVLILTTCWLAGRNRQQRFAYFLAIFAVWDIFYYVWLRILSNWPATIMDWDILFLIPVAWASPVLYPVLISLVWLVWAAIILYLDSCGRSLRPTMTDWLSFGASGLIVVASFCIVGIRITEPDFESYFYRSLFAAGLLLGILTFVKCCLKSGQKTPRTSV